MTDNGADGLSDLYQEVERPDGVVFVVRAEAAGRALREYDDQSGSGVGILLELIELGSVLIRRWVKPGWVVGVLLYRPPFPRIVHKERVATETDARVVVALLREQLVAGWRPKGR